MDNIISNKTNLPNNCVYFHINPLKNHVFYVGIGKKGRPYEKNNRRNDVWKRTVKKYGYIIDIVHQNLTWSEACELEKKYIKKIGRRDLLNDKNPSYFHGNLVNLTDGGDGNYGHIMSDEQRKKISISHKGKNTWSKGRKLSKETIEKRRVHFIGEKNHQWGKPLSDETKQKISRKKLGHTPWNKGKNLAYLEKCVLQFDKYGVFLNEFKSVLTAQEITSINKTSIALCANGKRNTGGGYLWAYKNQFPLI